MKSPTVPFGPRRCLTTVGAQGPTRCALFAGATLVLGLAFLPEPAAPRQADDRTALLVGTVRDAATGEPVSGALVSFDGGPRAIADSVGRFRMAGAPLGAQRLSVERFGYTRLELAITVTPTPEPLDLELRPDPVQIEGITVTGGARVALSGIVRDAATDDPLPRVRLWLTPDAVRDAGRGAADPQGIFSIPDVPTGSYLLRVELLGYVSQFVPVSVTAPPDPLQLRLEPDSAVLRGLAELTRQLRSRRSAYSGIATGYDIDRLLDSAAPSALHFLEYQTFLSRTPCDPENERQRSRWCVVGRGGNLVEARVFIDELPVMGSDQLDVLSSYRPEDFHLIELYGWNIVRAYTHEFIEQRARDPRLLLPAGVGGPGGG